MKRPVVFAVIGLMSLGLAAMGWVSFRREADQARRTAESKIQGKRERYRPDDGAEQAKAPPEIAPTRADSPAVAGEDAGMMKDR